MFGYSIMGFWAWQLKKVCILPDRLLTLFLLFPGYITLSFCEVRTYG